MARIAAARRRFGLASKTWSVWEGEGRISLEARVKLLEKLWTAGELTTTDYLVQLQRSLDTRIAAAELQGERWQAWLEWLNASGRMHRWLGGR